MLEINKIYKENCLKTMGKMPNEFIDLTVTSPPYDNLRSYNGYDFDFEPIARELYRVTENGGVVVWVVGDETINGSETGTSFRQALYFMECGFNLHDTMIWDKMGMRYPDATRYSNCFEYMFIFSKQKPKTVNLLKDRKNKYVGAKIARRKANRSVNGDIKENSAYRNDKNRKLSEFGVRFNIWQVKTAANERDILALKHPAPFSKQLAKEHILSWSNKNDLVFDPMCGSGTTAKMAIELNRNYIGSEISEEYCEIINTRIKNAEPELF